MPGRNRGRASLSPLFRALEMSCRTHLERGFRYARLAERRDDVDAEERHPAQQERAHDDAHRDGGLVVAHVIRRRVMMDGRERGRRGVLHRRRGRRRGCHRRGRRRRGRRRRRAVGQRPGDGPYALNVFLRVTVQPAVDADHHHARYVEADARRDHSVRRGQVQRARHVLGLARVEHHRLRRPRRIGQEKKIHKFYHIRKAARAKGV